MPLQFSIRILLWLTLVVAVACKAGPPAVRPIKRWLWPPETVPFGCISTPVIIIQEEDEALLAIPPITPEKPAP